MKYLILFLISFSVFARPIPPKNVNDIANDVYDEAETLPAYRVNVQAGNISYSPVGFEMVDSGSTISFTSTNVLDSAYVDVKTLEVDIDKVHVVNNSGGAFILRVGSTDVGYIAPGFTDFIDFVLPSTSIIRIKSISGTVSSGNIYFNYFAAE